jgi:intracellular septation protein
MQGLKLKYPFSADQTVNITSEMGPLVAMFIVNGVTGDVAMGTWALILSTAAALVTSVLVLGRPPIMPFIAGAVSITFGVVALVTGDPMWVQIKVTIFNAIVAVGLAYGLRRGRNFFQFVFGRTFHYTPEGWSQLTRNVAWFFLFTAVINEAIRLGFDAESLYHFDPLNVVLRGIDIWILFKLFFVMPVSAAFMAHQVWILRRHRLPAAAAGSGGPAQ